MFVSHPDKESIINLNVYADVRKCNVNLTHVDFYLKAPKAKRGKPDYTIVFGTTKERDAWFKALLKRL